MPVTAGATSTRRGARSRSCGSDCWAGSTMTGRRGARVWSIGQPALTLLFTVLVAVFVVAPPALTPSDVSSATTTVSTLAGMPSATAGRPLVRPGRGAPGALAPLAGPGMPAGDARVIRMQVGGRERGYLL